MSRDLLCILLLFFTLLSSCQTPDAQQPAVETPSDVEKKIEQKPEMFRPPVPNAKSFDWIRLKSGEWLKGEIKVMRKGRLEFDSDELDLLDLDWDDIHEVHSPRPQTVLLTGRVSHSGKSLLMREGIIVLAALETGEDDLRFARKDVMAVVPGSTKERDYWSGKISIGLAGRSGNTQSTDFSGTLFFRRETASTRFDSNYNGVFSQVSNTETAHNHRISSKYDVFMTDRMYVTPIAFGWYRDVFQNIETQFTPYTGVGYDVIDTPKIEWDVSVALGYQYTKAFSTQANAGDSGDTAVAVFGTKYEWDITPNVEFDIDYRITVPMPATHRYTHHASLTLEFDFVDDFDLDVALIWDRNNTPIIDENNVEPEQDDFRVTLELAYKF